MVVGDGTCEFAVGFFGPRRVDVTGPQAGFDVTDGDLLVVGCEAGGEGGSGVAMHKHDVGFEVSEHGF